jgi:uncharacterized protein (TIGR02646 family)
LGKTFGTERETDIGAEAVRDGLETALFEEQHGLCCYCGNAIERNWNAAKSAWTYRHKAIEHFEAKNKHKEKTFDYDNLLLCCKESQKLRYYEYGRVVNEIRIQGFDEVAQLSGLPVSTIRDYDKNRNIGKPKWMGGDKIYVPNPPHCDDEKSKYDSKPEECPIIHPAKDKTLIEKLIFTADGHIDYRHRETDLEPVIEKTFEVLALNCRTLVDRRREKWNNAKINYTEHLLPNWLREMDDLADQDDPRSLLTDNIRRLMEGKAKPNGEGLLEPFCFVEIAFLESLFNGGE